METVNHGSLSDLLCHANNFSAADRQIGSGSRARNTALMAEAEWRAAIAALAELLPTLPRQTTLKGHTVDVDAVDGIALSGPLPVLNEADFGQRFESWVVTPQPLATALQPQRFLSPAAEQRLPAQRLQGIQVLPLVLENPLLAERFCLVVTPTLSVALVLGQPTGGSPCFQYSFDPAVLIALWHNIRHYIAEPACHSLDPLNQRITDTLGTPDFRVITRFTQGMVANLPHRISEALVESDKHGNLHYTQLPNRDVAENGNSHLAAHAIADAEAESKAAIHADTELLQAMAHEIRTPLTTIRTLTRSLLRRKDVGSEIKKRLARIDEECTQQIDRFNLIFRAVELETTERDRPRSSLTPIALSQIFSDAVPRWQQQAQRRNLDLSVTLPPNLPRVNSDPTLLNEVLTGVVEWFTQCLPPHSHVHMVVMLAGHQLKLQFEAESTEQGGPFDCTGATKRQPLKSIGQLLTVVPETGGVSLNLDVTKNLFEFLGGKLILRQRPEQGEVLTAFLPLDTREI